MATTAAVAATLTLLGGIILKARFLVTFVLIGTIGWLLA